MSIKSPASSHPSAPSDRSPDLAELDAEFADALGERVSRSQRKRDNESLRRLGADLVELSAGRLAKLELPPALRRAIDEARRLEVHGARRRQIQFIGRLMEECDEAAIRASLAAIDWTPAALQPVQETEAMALAKALLAGDDATIFAWSSRYSPADLQLLRQAVRKAKKQRAAGSSEAAAAVLIERCWQRLVPL